MRKKQKNPLQKEGKGEKRSLLEKIKEKNTRGRELLSITDLEQTSSPREQPGVCVKRERSIGLDNTILFSLGKGEKGIKLKKLPLAIGLDISMSIPPV